MNFYATSAKIHREKKSQITPEVYSALDVLTKVKNQLMVGSAQPNSHIDDRVLSQVNHDLNTLLSVLVNPVFQRICKIQDSVATLEEQLSRHPSCTTNDFDITSEGKLVLKISPDEKREPFDKTPLPQIPKLQAESPLGTNGTPPPITTPVYAREFEKVIQNSSLGREIHTIKLFKPEGSSLGFSVVGLKSQDKGELGIFVQEIQPYGIAARDGRLCESDQILAINDFALDSAITHQQAIGILQKAKGEVEIVVARALEPLLPPESGKGLGSSSPQRPSTPSEDSTSKSQEMVLNTEYSQVEAIHLVNDGTGLGFGIIGGRSTGVVVKTILPGGVADRQGRLKSGDHILQISDVNLWGMGSDQVAAVLRQCGSSVRLVVARPCEPNSPDSISGSALIVPTKILGDPEELERHLMQANGYGMGTSFSDGRYDAMLPEVEIVDVELAKDAHGLGITIAGYVCEKEELSGIFVKCISEGSAADVSGKIFMNDRIIEVNGRSLEGFTNHEAVEVLRQTGDVVRLKLERFNYGQKYEQLQSAISHSEQKPPTPSSVSALSLPQPMDSDVEEEEEMIGPCEEFDEEDEELVVETEENPELDLEDLEILIDTRYEGEMLPTVEAAIMAKWSRIMGPDCDIVVAQISKGKDGGGLGISLEGTVDVEDGREVRPHHYIRSVLPDGPVGRSQKLTSGDELLEVNGRRLLGLNHVEVVHILKDLPLHVRIVCARRPGHALPCPIDTSQDKNAFAARNLLGGSMQDLLLSQVSERLIKASLSKSDGSLASTDKTEVSLSKVKSRSLEPLTGLAMWSSDPHVIELFKGDRGLGFSILDYQDPLNAADTVIVIRSLVPGGVAQQDGRIIPGDRLLAVNETNLENASLDYAVQTLKAAPKGIVRIVVAKPLPLDGATATPTTDEEDEFLEAAPPPLPITRPPEYEDLEDMQSPAQRDQVKVPVVPVATERLITQSGLAGVRGTTQFHAAKQPPPPVQIGRELEGSNAGGGTALEELPLSRRPPLDGEEATADQGRAPAKQFRTDATEIINGGPVVVPAVRSFGKQTDTGTGSPSNHETMNGKSLQQPPPPSPIEIQKRVVTHITIFPSPPSSAKEVLPVPLPPPPPSDVPVLAPPAPPEVSPTIPIKVVEPPKLPLPPPPLESSSSVELSSEEHKLPKMVVTSGGGEVTVVGGGEVALVEHAMATPTTSTDSGSGSGGGSGSTAEGSLLLARHWGPEKLVEIYREPNKSLGISIVGGKVDLYNSGGPDSQSPSAISGIFIKNVLPNSPAGKPGSFKAGSRSPRSQGLCVGDMILEVNGISLRAASHEKAVDIIRAAGNPVRFLVQSLVQWTEMGNSIDESEASRSSDTSHSQTNRSQSQSQSTTSSCTSDSTVTNSETSTASSSSYTTTRSVDGSTECYTSTEESDKVTQKPRHETISEVDDAEHQELMEDDGEVKGQGDSDIEEEEVVTAVTSIQHSPTTPERIIQ